ncbi:MAG TPA: PA4642 family protein [Candidatus Acidoferrum sp.]|nr:PA4642 family protein [Candidatus Acidoferrum sp.]
MKTEKKSGAARTQLAVTDEWWSDARVQAFLGMQPVEGEDADYHVLLKAYRGMVPEAFERFIAFFLDAGRNLNAPGPGGKTIFKLISEHRHGTEYAQILKQAGAQ